MLNGHHICHIITGLGTGGAERSLFNLLNSDIRNTYTQNIISLTGPGKYGPRIEEMGLSVTCLSLKTKPWNIVRLPIEIKSHKPSIVQGWMYHGNLAALFGKWFGAPKAKLAWNIRHSLDDFSAESSSTRIAIQLNRILSRTVDKIVFNANSSLKLHRNFGFFAKHLHVIPNGFDTSIYKPDPELRSETREMLKIGSGATVIAHVGRFHPVKNHALFLKATLPLVEDNPNLHLVMSGGGVSYSTKFFKDIIPDYLACRIHLLGDRKDVAALLTSSNIFVQSSNTEAFPNVLAEAMASGCLCIATDVGDCLDILGGAGHCVPPRNAGALQNAICSALNYPEKSQIFATQARASICRDYPIDRTIERYMALYSDLSKL